RKPVPKNGRKSSRKKNQTREEGRRIFSESVEENPAEEDPILNRPYCIHSISPLTLRNIQKQNPSITHRRKSLLPPGRPCWFILTARPSGGPCRTPRWNVLS